MAEDWAEEEHKCSDKNSVHSDHGVEDKSKFLELYVSSDKVAVTNAAIQINFIDQEVAGTGNMSEEVVVSGEKGSLAANEFVASLALNHVVEGRDNRVIKKAETSKRTASCPPGRKSPVVYGSWSVD